MGVLGLEDFTPSQHDAVDWLQYRTEALLALQVGFGKTIITLTALARLREMYGPWRTLLVSTKSICEHTWGEELDGWSHLPPLSYASAAGRDLAAVQSDPDILAVNYESLEWYLDLVDRGQEVQRDVLVVDESSKLKAHDSARVARLAGLRRITKKDGVKHSRSNPGFVDKFRRRWLLSATPAPEGYQGLWAQEACMSERRRLGENITSFRNEFCTRDRSGFGWVVIPALEREIERRLRHVMYLPKESDSLGLPPVTHSRVVIPWALEARAQYKEMEDELELALEAADPDTPMDEIEVVAPNAGVLLSKLRQLCSGFLYDAEGNAHPSLDPDAKLDALDGVRERIGEAPLLVFTQFKSEMRSIGERYRDARVGLPDSLADWNAKLIPMLVLHPASAGHGLNLQHGTNVCLYYSLPFSYEQWHQSWGRLHRRGQTRPVSALRFERPNSVDQDVWNKVQGKRAKLSDFLDHMRRRRHNEVSSL
jgi:SNF2 family DNA or RNA helicase